METASRYPLGTDSGELERLHLQHRLWSDAAHALWARAQIAPGAHVLDIGAGPGAAAFDLAALTTSTGRVVAVDESEHFVRHIQEQARARRMAHVAAIVADVQKLLEANALAPASFDLAYARWVLCFTARPRDVVHGVASLLKPGASFAIHDYFNYEIMTTAPRRASYTRVVGATARSWRDSGGDPDVVARLPRLLDEAGFELVHLASHSRIARPGDTMWHWAATWWRSYAPKLAAKGYVTTADVEELESDVASMTRDSDFLVMPPVFEILARKR
jgi:SAM-dependent methyltransferase